MERHAEFFEPANHLLIPIGKCRVEARSAMAAPGCNAYSIVAANDVEHRFQVLLGIIRIWASVIQ